MKKLSLLFVAAFLSIGLMAQDDPKKMHETARAFMQTGDYDNAIIVLTRALLLDKNSLDMQKDLVMSYYLKRDYTKALEGVKEMLDRNDADVHTFQIAGNVYKALEEVKECEKMYKRALKKFPKSGPLYSEYGELLWARKDFNAITQWEKGIDVDPNYSGNYYNAAVYYFYAKDKVWSLIYGEIFVNMESMSERGAAMKEQLLNMYKEKLFAEADLMKDEEKNKNEFAKAFLQTMNKQSSLASKGINTEVLTMIRTRFILDWYTNVGGRFPYRLFEYQQQLIKEGMFAAYNQWLFGATEDLAAYETWTKNHAEEYNNFNNFLKSRIFRMPGNQHYNSAE
jgi:Tfp pilus assembly protein PilF